MSARRVQMPSQFRLRECLVYEPSTGALRWADGFGRNCHVKGRIAGGINNRGYRTIRIDGRTYLVHRIIWVMFHGVMPIACIDHINGVRDDNKISNLRDVSVAENTQNQRHPNRVNKSGFLGVFKCRDKWRAAIELGGKTIAIGRFDSPELAHHAYIETKRRLHPGCTL